MELAAACLLSLTAGYLFGYHIRDLRDRLASVRGKLKRHNPPALKSSIIEPPLTAAEQVARDQAELIARLNP